jgi:hypothetical protein
MYLEDLKELLRIFSQYEFKYTNVEYKDKMCHFIKEKLEFLVKNGFGVYLQDYFGKVEIQMISVACYGTKSETAIRLSLQIDLICGN